MPDPILFSVIIPTYNRAHLIGHTIESVRKQKYSHYEIIVVDNCSTDNTAEVLRPLYETGIITYIRNEKNYERGYSRNIGFRKAKGGYVTLLDSDDILYPDCLEDAAAYIAAHPGSRFFYCLHEYVNEQYEVVRKVPSPPIKNPFKELMKGNFISNIAAFYTNELVQKVQFDENPQLVGSEDYDFVIRILAETRSLGQVDKVNAAVLLHPQRTLMMDRAEPTIIRIKLLIDKQLQSKAFMECFKQYKHIFIANLQLYLSGFVATRGYTWKALGFWLRSLKHDFSLFFTKKFWMYLFIIIKYTFR